MRVASSADRIPLRRRATSHTACTSDSSAAATQRLLVLDTVSRFNSQSLHNACQRLGTIRRVYPSFHLEAAFQIRTCLLSIANNATIQNDARPKVDHPLSRNSC